MGLTWGPTGSCRPQMGPMNLAMRVTHAVTSSHDCHVVWLVSNHWQLDNLVNSLVRLARQKTSKPCIVDPFGVTSTSDLVTLGARASTGILLPYFAMGVSITYIRKIHLQFFIIQFNKVGYTGFTLSVCRYICPWWNLDLPTYIIFFFKILKFEFLANFYPAALMGSGVLSYPERAGWRTGGRADKPR